MIRKDLVLKLTEWIDRPTIANMIVNAMEEDKKALCLEDAKTIWLDVLENELPEALKTSCTYAHLDNNGI